MQRINNKAKAVKKRTGILRIGTSNITLPGNKQSFPPAFRDKTRLNYYSSIFNTLEVNSSFYKVPMLSTFQKWSQDVPDNFQFSLKLWRGVTHVKDLAFNVGDIENFLVVADGTGDKKGCILVQFPKKISLNYYKQLEKILQVLSKYNLNNSWRKAIEFRDASWYSIEILELLHEHSASLVLHDKLKINNFESSDEADFIYLRFHGPKADYKGSYSDEFLTHTADQIKKWLELGKDVYAYFNNTIGNAFENAVSLKTKIEKSY